MSGLAVTNLHPTSNQGPALDPQALIKLGQYLHDSGYRFITPTPVTHQRVNDRQSNASGETLEAVFGWNRPFPRGLLPLEQERDLLANGVIERRGEQLISCVRWSTLNDLLLLHSAFPTLQEDSVFFGPDTYRFAQSIARHLHEGQRPIGRAVDIGCGTGAGALLIAKACPEARVFAVDINPKALAFTGINAQLAGLDNIEALHSNVLIDVDGEFDLIVANPPYMKDSKQRAYRHGGDALGADLSVRIVRESVERLSMGGTLVLYTGVAIVQGADPFIAAVQGCVDATRYKSTYRELDPDVFGEELLEPGYERVERIAAVELVVTRLV
jgi:methylase of polypeptide subunit release factors